MAMKPFIRIVKGGQKATPVEGAAGGELKPQRPDSSARVIKATVSNWVREFQQRSRTDAKLAFNNLFTEPLARPSET